MNKENKKFLGIEFGSTRIKAVIINGDMTPIDKGEHTWASTYKNDIWTYDINDAWIGFKDALSKLNDRSGISHVGISGMMHGYLVFDKDWNLLVPFRTWQNTITGQAAAVLTEKFNFNIPQRWTAAHLYQAVLNNEAHVSEIAHVTTLAGYMHYMLTGVNAIGIGEASGMFPVDSATKQYDKRMLSQFDELIKEKGISWSISDVLPDILLAGESAGTLTEKGAQLIDGLLPVGTPFAPPEGDAQTGMVATNAVMPKTGNISAGTSIFSLIVLEKPLQNVHEEIDVVCTPDGKDVALVHGNNCTADSNAWVSLISEASALLGANVPMGEVYTKLYEESLNGDADCGGVLVCNYLAGEGITHFDEGRPMVIRRADSKFTLANFFRATLYSTMATFKLGMDILATENVTIDSLTAHGGLFKTPLVGQRYMAAACNAPITCMTTAGEGGPYGMAILAAYCHDFSKGLSLGEYLSQKVFKNADGITLPPNEADVEGFNKYIENYKKLLIVEKTATSVL